MNILQSLLKIYPNWKGTVEKNAYDGIKPHADEKRPIPTLSELEDANKQIMSISQNQYLLKQLKDIDEKSIRSLREWISAQPDSPSFIKDYEEKANVIRKQIKPKENANLIEKQIKPE